MAFEIEKLKNEDFRDFFEHFDTVQNWENPASASEVFVGKGGQSVFERTVSGSCQEWTLES